MIFGDPDVKLVFGQVRDIAGQRGGVVVHGFAGENPAHVGPPFAINRRMRIAFLVRKLMMNAVGRDPENRSAFKGQCCANGQEILDPLRSLVAAVGQQSVIRHPDPQTARDQPEGDGRDDGAAIDDEERRDRSDVERGHRDHRDRVQTLLVLTPVHERRHRHQTVVLCAVETYGTICTITGRPECVCNTCVRVAKRLPAA